MRTRRGRITALVGLGALGALAIVSLGSDVWEFYVSLFIGAAVLLVWLLWQTRSEPPDS